MPVTTANLNGIVINEIGASPDASNIQHDIDGDGVASGSGDEYVEFFNTSGSPVDISGWQLWIIDDGSSNSGLVHTFAGGTIIAPGGYMVVIDNEGAGVSPQNIGSAQGVISNGNAMTLTEDDNFILYDPSTNQYVEMLGENHNVGDLAAINNIFGPTGFNATKIGSEQLPNLADPSGISFQRAPDGDTAIYADAQTAGIANNCFLPGTLISSPDGERPIEELKIGDDILTHDGRVIAVKWIGRQTISTRFGPADRLMPIRFAAGSLGNGLPHSDLTVTADHAMLIDGTLCNAGALVNGTTIARVPLSELGELYTVFHVEVEYHEIILANGAPSESFLDTSGRRAFDNAAEFNSLHGEAAEMKELPLPRATSQRQVPESIRARLSPKVA